MKKQLITMAFTGLLFASSSYAGYYDQERNQNDQNRSNQSKNEKEEVAVISSPPSNTRQWYKNPENREAYMRGESRNNQKDGYRNSDAYNNNQRLDYEMDDTQSRRSGDRYYRSDRGR